MPNKSPIFPIPQHPHHFSDYGFDPQMGYSQVLEEAKKHKRETFPSRSTESLHFKLQKPISKQESKKKKRRSKRWKNALLFCKKKWVYQNEVNNHHTADNYIKNHYRGGGSSTMSGPIYITESRSGSSTPCRSTSGPLTSAAWALIQPTKSTRAPYLNLIEMNSDDQHPMPIYLVT